MWFRSGTTQSRYSHGVPGWKKPRRVKDAATRTMTSHWSERKCPTAPIRAHCSPLFIPLKLVTFCRPLFASPSWHNGPPIIFVPPFDSRNGFDNLASGSLRDCIDRATHMPRHFLNPSSVRHRACRMQQSMPNATMGRPPYLGGKPYSLPCQVLGTRICRHWRLCEQTPNHYIED